MIPMGCPTYWFRVSPGTPVRFTFRIAQDHEHLVTGAGLEPAKARNQRRSAGRGPARMVLTQPRRTSRSGVRPGHGSVFHSAIRDPVAGGLTRLCTEHSTVRGSCDSDFTMSPSGTRLQNLPTPGGPLSSPVW
jgi:hypothetical protein